MAHGDVGIGKMIRDNVGKNIGLRAVLSRITVVCSIQYQTLVIIPAFSVT